MPTVTINIAAPGTPLTDGGTSSVGHMWYSLDNGQGNVNSYGFAPDVNHHGDPIAPGQSYYNDNTNYQSTSYSKTIEITQSQYDAMKDFGDNPSANGFDMGYNGATNSCIDFTWAALQKGGMNPDGYQGDLSPSQNINDIQNLMSASNGLFGDLINDFLNEIGDIGLLASDLFNAGRNWIQRRDPLTLDLDNDGLETLGINTANPILFDHDGDGVKTGTGWVAADDGFLVLDRNGNGTIDSGIELFGDSTPLLDAQGNEIGKAVDGFAALADQDTNLDGKVDATDACFADLRIWRDLNQDGISQSNELSTLAALNIASINVAKTENTTVLANGNVIADLGTYVKTDGSIATLGETAQLGDVDLADNPFYSQFPDTLPITPEAAALPDMQGSGMVRDLREAA